MKNRKSEISITEILEGSHFVNHDREPETVDADTVASWLGLTPRRVIGLAKEGAIPTVGRGRYDLRAAVAGYCDALRRSAAGRGVVDKDYRDARTRAASAQAAKLEAVTALATGDLVKASDVAVTWSAILTDVRAALLAVPSRLPELDRKAAARVDEEIRLALEGLADAG